MNQGIIASGYAPLGLPNGLLGRPTPVPVPDQFFHPEAQSWRTRVLANGGTFKVSTLAAVSRFCVAIDGAGIRDRFYRLNLFCGDNLQACLVPLYRGESPSGAQYGNLIDANVNFVSADYQESGSLSGLTKLAGVTKYLNTNVQQIALPQVQTLHLAVSIRGFYASGFVAGTSGNSIFASSASQISGGISGEWGSFTQAINPGRIVFSRTASNVGRAYRNAGNYTTSTTDVGTLTADSRSLAVFGLGIANPGTPGNGGSFRITSYSFGNGMTPAQVSAYDAAILAFETALSRT